MFHFALSETVKLRLIEERDAAELYALIEADRDYLARWMPWAQEETLEGVRAFIRLARKHLADSEGLSGRDPRPGADHRHRRVSRGGLAAPLGEHRLLAGCRSTGKGHDDARGPRTR